MKSKWYFIVGIIVVISIPIYITYLNSYFCVWGCLPSTGTTLQSSTTNACLELTRANCNVPIDSIIIEDFDANKNGYANDADDTLFELCKKYYGIETESECKTKVCGCPDECIIKNPDPDGYLLKICKYLQEHKDTIIPNKNPNEYNIKEVEEGVYQDKNVLVIRLDCCFMGDLAYVDKETDEVIGFSPGDV